jgi:hypothetical protein
MKKQNTAYHVHDYSMSIATGTLHKHLLSYHSDEWVSECKRLNISIKPVAGFKMAGDKSSKAQTPSCPSYSPELFMDALVNFIAATDQVLFFFYISFLLLKDFSSL